MTTDTIAAAVKILRKTYGRHGAYTGPSALTVRSVNAGYDDRTVTVCVEDADGVLLCGSPSDEATAEVCDILINAGFVVAMPWTPSIPSAWYMEGKWTYVAEGGGRVSA